ncbi:MAG: DUF2027 domain-containing protein [Porphyromonas sp.]|nr:DUF2027 domain-containing protein [Porphyromonas sp.]
MSKVRIGDKVRFLDAQGGGVVKRIVGKVAYVEDQDGFEIPTPLHECVVVGEKDGFAPAYTPPTSLGENSLSKQSEPKPAEDCDRISPKTLIRPDIISSLPIRKNDKLNLLLAFLPMDEKKLGQEPYECYMVNDSNYAVSFSYMSREGGGWQLRAAGTIEPNTQIFIEEIASAQINSIERVCLQFLAYKTNSAYEIKPATSVELRIDGAKFFKLHAFVENDFFDERALLYYAIKDDVPQRMTMVSAVDLKQSMQSKRELDMMVEKPKRSISSKPDNTPIEIDLHAHSLLDSLAGMQPKDILDYQLRVFHETLAEHKGRKGCRIVFIHGKGEGVLRKAIETELKHKYKGYTYQDASFKEYGFGATMVTIY